MQETVKSSLCDFYWIDGILDDHLLFDDCRAPK